MKAQGCRKWLSQAGLVLNLPKGEKLMKWSNKEPRSTEHEILGNNNMK